MSEWMMVEVASRDENGNPRIKGAGPFDDCIMPKEFVHPLPPAITPEEKAVVDAVMNAIHSGIGQIMPTPVWEAANALIASRTPPDPLRELVEALSECGEFPSRIERALSAARAELDRKAVAR